MNPFSLAIPIGFFGPVLTVSICAYLWRASLPHLGWFVAIGIIASYILMATCFIYAFSEVGITGQLTNAPKPTFYQLTVRYFCFMLAWLAGTGLVLLLTRRVLAKI